MPKGGNESDPAELITNYIAELEDWRGEMIGQIRKVILQAESEITEDWKWGSPIWVKDGMICASGAFKDHVKLNFFKGASLEDPKGVFNAGLDAKTTRAIDLQKGDKIPTAEIKALVRAAARLNQSSGSKKG